MNGMELRRGLYFGCDVFSGGVVTRLQNEGETCEVMLNDKDRTKAVLYSDGYQQGFYIQFPLKLPDDVERYYPFVKTDNTFLKLAYGIARAT